MPSISSLYVDLSLQADNFINGLKDAQKEAKEMEKTLKPLKVAAEDLGKTFTVVGGLVTTAFAGMVKASSDYGETLNKVSIQTGITTEQLSALKYVAEQEETSFDALTVGLKKMSVTAVQNAAAFEGIGVQVKDASGAMRPMNDILLDAAKRFASMHDETKRTALEVEIFGRSGSDLNELLLRLGTEGLAPATAKVQELGLEMSGKTAHAADDFNDSIKEIEGAVLGLSNAVASALLPELTDTSHSLRDAIIAAKDFAKEHEALTRAIGLSGVALTGVGGFLLGLAGVVTIFPKVVAGLNAIAAGIASITLAAAAATAGVTAAVAALLYMEKLRSDIASAQKDKQAIQEVGVNLILKEVAALRSQGIAIEQGTLSWQEYAQQVNDAYRGMVQLGGYQATSSKAQTAIFAKSAKEIQEEMKIEEKWRQANSEIYKEQVTNAEKFVNAWLTGFQRTSDEADKMTDRIQKQEVATSKLAETSVDAALTIAQAMVHAHDAWDEANGKTFNSNAKLFNEIEGLRHTDLDNQVEILTKRVAVEQKMADASAKAWKNAMENLNTRVAESLADMIVKAKFNFSTLVNIAQTTAKGMLSAFLSGLMSPLTNALGGLGAKLSGLITGGGGSAVGTATNAGTGAAGGAAGGLFGLSGLATLGIGAGVAAVAALAAHFIGQGRKTANEFVSQFQNPFGAQLAQVSASGTVSDLDQIWATFNQTAAQFASQGGNQAKVVSQAHATLDPLVAQIRSDLAAKAASTTVNVTVQGNVMPGMTDQIVQGMLDALQTNQGGMVTALQGAVG
jgi:hypothetical protein